MPFSNGTNNRLEMQFMLRQASKFNITVSGWNLDKISNFISVAILNTTIGIQPSCPNLFKECRMAEVYAENDIAMVTITCPIEATYVVLHIDWSQWMVPALSSENITVCEVDLQVFEGYGVWL